MKIKCNWNFYSIYFLSIQNNGNLKITLDTYEIYD